MSCGIAFILGAVVLVLTVVIVKLFYQFGTWINDLRDMVEWHKMYENAIVLKGAFDYKLLDYVKKPPLAVSISTNDDGSIVVIDKKRRRKKRKKKSARRRLAV